jgi:anaerobic magnesium-protoporphyrin IX monomethyl ester cyclase
MSKTLHKMSRALLVHPPTGPYVREDRCQAYVAEGMVASALRPPMEIAYVAALLEKEGIECRIRDYPVEGGGVSGLRGDLAGFRPDLFLVCCVSPSLDKDLDTCKVAKRISPETITVARGTHFLVFDEEPLQNHRDLDFVVRGEPEYTVLELAQGKPSAFILGISYLEGAKIRRNGPRPYIDELDQLPFPARHLIRNELYVRADTGQPQATIQTSRGCPYGCLFCLARMVSGHRIRQRSPANIVREIRECADQFGIRDYFFRSDTFTADKEWTLSVCSALLDANLGIRWVCNSRVDTLDVERLRLMKASGCWGISLGVESGSPEMLHRMRKGIDLEQAKETVRLCRSHGILSFAYFVVGLPWETRDTLRQTFRFSRSLDSDLVEYYFAYPYPGTDLYKLVTRYGLMTELPPESQSAPAFSPFAIDEGTMEKMRRRALLLFYLRPKSLLRLTGRIRSPRQAYHHLHLAWQAYRKNYRKRGKDS